jgi:TP901 family phage tail tape measure protein
MTAVWNNFYDGSKSLEYYADVMTALGAATASSTEEIATGLEKFAAVSETVGLSYEYATAALATVTATTRQSADVVGTAFKTLFARIQDLKLGETLDDGTTLGKYAEALKSVGINIKDSSGNLKEMDTILDEMGAKWEKLDKDQQVALAKSVAGVRQYTHLIALMNNWDFMKENLNTVQGSSGELEK